jgi:hypothetical protein
VFQLLYSLTRAIEPFLVPICFVSAWVLVMLVGWSFLSAIASATTNAKRMHQIPCAYCVFFTNDPRLKCPVHPTRAMSEEAIDCGDFREG